MMHDRLHDHGFLKHHDSTNQIVVSFRKILERPQVSLVPVTGLAQIDNLKQHRVRNITLDHPQSGMAGNHNRTLESYAGH